MRGESSPTIIPDEQMARFRFMLDYSEEAICMNSAPLSRGEKSTCCQRSDWSCHGGWLGEELNPCHAGWVCGGWIKKSILCFIRKRALFPL